MLLQNLMKYKKNKRNSICRYYLKDLLSYYNIKLINTIGKVPASFILHDNFG